MAEAFEGRLSITGADEVERELARVEQQMRDLSDAQGETTESSDELSESTDGTTESMGGLKTSTVAAAAAVAAIAAGIKEAAEAVVEFGAELEKQAGVINRLDGDISNASDRVNGLVSDFDLMVARSRLARAGVELTAEEFGDLAVAATETAAATGEDATAAINRYGRAVARAQTGALKDLNVDLQGITATADKQRSAVRQLSEQYGGTESSADTLGGQFDVLSTKLDNAETDFIEALNATSSMEEGFSDLEKATQHLAEAFDVGESKISIMESTAIALAAAIGAVGEQMALVGDSIANLEEGNFEEAAKNIGEFFGTSIADRTVNNIKSELEDQFGVDAEMTKRAMEQAGSQTPEGGFATAFDEDAMREFTAGIANDTGGGGGQRGPAVDAAETDLDQLARQLEDENAIADARERQLDALEIANRWHARNVREVEREKAAAQEFRAELSETARKAQDVAREFRAMADEQRRNLEEQRQEQQRTMESGVRSGMDVVEGLGKAIASSQDDALQEWLKAQAKRWGFKALEETALGIATLIMNPPEASTHFIAAGMFGGLAAAAGAGSAAAGGGASKGGAQSQAGASPESSPGGGRDRGGGTTIVNVNSPVPEVELGRTTARAMRAANRVRAA